MTKLLILEEMRDDYNFFLRNNKVNFTYTYAPILESYNIIKYIYECNKQGCCFKIEKL